MNVRRATLGDLDLLHELVDELEAVLPPEPYSEDSWDEDRPKVEAMVRDGVAAIAEEDGRARGYVLARFRGSDRVFVSDLYVREDARGQGLAKQLLAVVVADALERGATHLVLEVATRNDGALSVYRRLGFEEASKVMRVGLPELEERLTRSQRESLGAVHVQTDGAQAVEQVVTEYLPRLKRGATASVDGGPGWTAVRVEPFDRNVLRKLGQELSYRFGVTVILAVEDGAVVRFVVHEQGRMVDEYLSVPEYYGSLPPGDALALRANPTVVSRLTGAEPARVRAVVRTAQSQGDLPPAHELYAQIADVLGLRP